MPFDHEPTEIAYRLVVKPLIEIVFGGKCIRLRHKVGHENDDWQKMLLKEFVSSHAFIFDLSYDNEHVRREREFYRIFCEIKGGRFRDEQAIHISTMSDDPFPEMGIPKPVRIRPTIVDDTLYYHWQQDYLLDFSHALRDRIQSALEGIGFERGVFDLWVLYPKTTRYDLEWAAAFESYWLQEGAPRSGRWIQRLRTGRFLDPD